MNSYDYPEGADNYNAPWNQVDLPDKEIEVTISVTLVKTVSVKVNDYRTEEDADEDGRYLAYDYSGCDLYKAVEDQVVLPQNLAEFTERMFNHDLDLKAAGMPKYLKGAIEDCKDWYVDELIVNKE